MLKLIHKLVDYFCATQVVLETSLIVLAEWAGYASAAYD
jgi:hypothetical protein